MSAARILVALGVISALGFGMHYYVWARLVRDTGLAAPWSTIARLSLIVLGLAILASFVTSRIVSRSAAAPLAWIAYTWLGVLFFLVIALACADLARGVFVLARKAAGEPLDPERRLAVARLLGGAVGLTAVGASAAGVAIALERVAVKRVRVPIAKLRSSYRIVQLTDVHVGPTIGREFVEEIVARTNALEPDVVAITGDLVDGTVDDLAALVEPLRKLRAKHGVFFVTGNHEYYSGARAWIEHLGTLGVKVLENARVAIAGEHGFDLAGVNDWNARTIPGHEPDLPRALEGRDRSRALVLLAHQPRAVTEAAEHGVDLQLSGHTHGGQLFPWNLLVRLQQPFVAGLHALGKTAIYVSQGTGYWGPPMRLGTRAEITDIEIAAA